MVSDQLDASGWRAELAARLADYARTVEDAGERAMAAEFAPFVARHADCLRRTCRPGHLTASAWVVDEARSVVLLTHHRKLDRWLQLGGHADGNPDLAAAALREAREESGLQSLTPVSAAIFDLDRHLIPSGRDEPEHWHYDVRYQFTANPAEPVTVSAESRDLAWVTLAEVAVRNPSESLARMVRKTLCLRSTAAAAPRTSAV